MHPQSAVANISLLTVLDDDSILASGDQSKRQTYDVSLGGDLKGVTALRLEVLPDERLPANGPGRTDYEGPPGEFFLSEMTGATANGPVKFAAGSQSFAGAGGADKVIDGDPLTGWSINGGQGKPHTAVFRLAEPLGETSKLDLQLVCERYYASGLGRFRLSVSRDPRELTAHAWTSDIEQLLLKPDQACTPEERQHLMRSYLSIAPQLATARAEIQKLRDAMPQQPTTLAFRERPANYPRPTFLHKRGEFLQPTERVEPDVLSLLPGLPEGGAAQSPGAGPLAGGWAKSADRPGDGQPAVAGIVRPGDRPYDRGFWLPGRIANAPGIARLAGGRDGPAALVAEAAAADRDQRHVSTIVGRLGRLAARDPQNLLLGRGPRFRLEAELIRDLTLRASGLLAEKIGGPSVFPPQPAAAAAKEPYGPLDWKTSTGEDRYRRGLYTFANGRRRSP